MNDNNSGKEENNSNKVHKSLKDNPRPFATPALRKKKENELHNKPNKFYYVAHFLSSFLKQELRKDVDYLLNF